MIDPQYIPAQAWQEFQKAFPDAYNYLNEESLLGELATLIGRTPHLNEWQRKRLAELEASGNLVHDYYYRSIESISKQYEPLILAYLNAIGEMKKDCEKPYQDNSDGLYSWRLDSLDEKFSIKFAILESYETEEDYSGIAFALYKNGESLLIPFNHTEELYIPVYETELIQKRFELIIETADPFWAIGR